MVELVEKALDVAESKKVGNDNKNITDGKHHKIVLVSPFFDNFGRTNFNFVIFKVLIYTFTFFYISTFLIEYILFGERYEESLAKTIESTIFSVLWYINFLINGFLTLLSNISFFIIGLFKAIYYIIWKVLYVYLDFHLWDKELFKLWQIMEKRTHFDISIPNFFDIEIRDKIRMHIIMFLMICFFSLYGFQYYVQRIIFGARITSLYVPLPFLLQFFKRKKNKQVDLYLIPAMQIDRIHSRGALNYAISGFFGLSSDNYEIKFDISSRYFSYYTKVTLYIVKKGS